MPDGAPRHTSDALISTAGASGDDLAKLILLNLHDVCGDFGRVIRMVPVQSTALNYHSEMRRDDSEVRRLAEVVKRNKRKLHGKLNRRRRRSVAPMLRRS